MKTLCIPRLYLLCFVFFLSVTAHADTMQREIIELQHMPAKEIIPLIRPFLDKNGSIAADGNNIILETTAENMQQVIILIQELDIPGKQLQISVSLDPGVIQTSRSANKAQATQQTDKTTDTIEPAIAADSSLVYKTRGREVTPGIQVIKVLQDRWSMIRTGQSIPIINRVRNPDGTMTESVSYQQLNQGLRIKPHLSGLKVVLYVQPFYEAENQTGPGKKLYYKTEKVTHTTLGSWVGLEATSGSKITINKTWLQQNQLSTDPISVIFLKVEVVP